MFSHIPPQFYFPLFLYGTTLLCLILGIRFIISDNNDLLLKKYSAIPLYALTLLIIWFIGTRPVHYLFGDTVTYAHTYSETSPFWGEINWGKEWIFSAFRTFCRKMDWSVHTYFLLIASGYVGFQTIACRKLLWENPWMAMLFMFSAFSFFTFGVNGLRNGLACSMLLLAIAFAVQKNYWVTVIICLVAFGIHRSTILPSAALATAIFVIKKPKWAIWFWVASIPISLLFGGPISTFFGSLGFDDRMQDYFNEKYYTYGEFSSTGFRWDFLLYSSMPILLTWYVNRKNETSIEEKGKEIADPDSMRAWNIIATTYILCNAFWVMVNRAAFSNRFAYLSWFMYPLVIAYAVIRLHLWEDQDRKAAFILLAHVAFTIGLHLTGIV